MTRWWPAIWKTIPWARRYAVSDRGEVRSANGMLAAWINDEGYRKIAIREDDGAKRNYFVHKLVADLHLPPPRVGDRYVLHRNNCRVDCSASNLRWGTHAQNHADKVAAGTARLGAIRKLTCMDVKAIRASSESAPEIAARLGISVSHAREVKNGRKWAWLDESRQQRLAI